MTLVLNLPVEVETELRQSAAARGVAVEDYAVERLRGPRNREFQALDDLVALGARLTTGAAPLSDDAVARSYADYHDAKEAA